MKKTLRLILGDQLNEHHSWFSRQEEHVVFLMMEVLQETNYAHHHIQKVVGFFQAMRNFRKKMEEQGHQFIYLTLDDPANLQTIPGNVEVELEKGAFEAFEYQLPDEHRLDVQLAQFCSQLSKSWKAVDSEHFYTERNELSRFFKGKKTYLMESFYRHMRKKHGILMEEEGPVSGRWNYDQENRKKLPKNHYVPAPPVSTKNVEPILHMVENKGVATLGAIDAQHFFWPSSREEALQILEHFCQEYLPWFGTYQDAMDTRYPFVYHSLLSFALNTKMLNPREVVNRVTQEWQNQPQKINIAQVEGYIRQIVGWREYMRGVYWAHMPEYATRNNFGHHRPLPDFYWTGQTKMNCLRHAIGQSLTYAYAHHIQRLMITGNFALLAQVNPDDVDAWYLGIYIDAIEWVEITNTRGMSQFADGGLVGSKPYVSSANYIHKMSNYCESCHYNKSKKYGEGACPFNALYWLFYHTHRGKLERNPRIGMMYRTLDKMETTEKEKILSWGRQMLEQVNSL